jgi:hypothetical protein
MNKDQLLASELRLRYGDNPWEILAQQLGQDFNTSPYPIDITHVKSKRHWSSTEKAPVYGVTGPWSPAPYINLYAQDIERGAKSHKIEPEDLTKTTLMHEMGHASDIVNTPDFRHHKYLPDFEGSMAESMLQQRAMEQAGIPPDTEQFPWLKGINPYSSQKLGVSTDVYADPALTEIRRRLRGDSQSPQASPNVLP